MDQIPESRTRFLSGIIRRSLVWKSVFVLSVVLMVIFTLFVLVNNSLSSALYRQSLDQSVHHLIQGSRMQIDRLSMAMEQKALELAATGSLLYQAVQENPAADIDTLSEAYLTDSFSSFPAGLGGGIWFEPDILGNGRTLYGPYAFHDQGKVTFTWDLSTAEYNYPAQSWYTTALPADWDRSSPRPAAIYWTPPYVDEAGSNALMIRQPDLCGGQQFRHHPELQPGQQGPHAAPVHPGLAGGSQGSPGRRHGGAGDH